MAIQTLAAPGLRADVDLGTMRAGQSLGSLTARLFHELDEFFRLELFDTSENSLIANLGGFGTILNDDN